ncbi:hypothetical protein [Ensifer sp. 4252]|uniref:hypothetical protein n=1 Tax=Ensifer sp. 4252 TaxID=3373915 RepID=UPI003D1A5AC4
MSNDKDALLQVSPNTPLLETVVADRFGLSVADFQRYCQLGLIIVSVDKGSCDTRESHHIKCCLGNRVWEATMDADGRITFEAMTFVRRKLAKIQRR